MGYLLYGFLIVVFNQSLYILTTYETISYYTNKKYILTVFLDQYLNTNTIIYILILFIKPIP